jgi:hypothetical protein
MFTFKNNILDIKFHTHLLREKIIEALKSPKFLPLIAIFVIIIIILLVEPIRLFNVVRKFTFKNII